MYFLPSEFEVANDKGHLPKMSEANWRLSAPICSSKPLRGSLTVCGDCCLMKWFLYLPSQLEAQYLLPDKVKRRKEDTMSKLIKRFKEDLQSV